MRRVCAEYAQIFFPESAAGIPSTLASLGNLGSAAGVPWSALGFSERTSWTVQATKSSLSVGRAQGDSTQRGGPRKAAEEAKPIGDGAVSTAFTYGVRLLQGRRSHGVLSGVLYLMVSKVTYLSMGRAQRERSPKGRYGYLSRSVGT